MNIVRRITLAEWQTSKIQKICSMGYATRHPVRFLETQDMWRETDLVPKRWQLIYKAPMGNGLKFATAYLTATTGLIGLGGIYYGIFVFDVADLAKPVVIGDDVVIANSPIECFTYLGAFIAIHVAVKILLSKYVVRLYQDGDKYLAIYRGNLFKSTIKHEFHLKEFKKLKPFVIIPWSESRYSLGKKQGILMENYFKTPEHFNYLLNNGSKSKDKIAEEE